MSPAFNNKWFHKPDHSHSIDVQGPQWNGDQISQYLKTVNCFLARCALLTLILSGQPARGTEPLSLRLESTLTGGCRNIFLHHGLFMFVALYHKGLSTSGITKAIYRFLPKELSEALAQYLILIRPFAHHLHHISSHTVVNSVSIATGPSLSPFLWVQKNGNPWDTTRLSAFFASESSRILRAQSRLIVASYHHVAIAISREFIPKGSYFDRSLGQDA